MPALLEVAMYPDPGQVDHLPSVECCAPAFHIRLAAVGQLAVVARLRLGAAEDQDGDAARPSSRGGAPCRLVMGQLDQRLAARVDRRVQVVIGGDARLRPALGLAGRGQLQPDVEHGVFTMFKSLTHRYRRAMFEHL
jgi:hypothetical protein